MKRTLGVLLGDTCIYKVLFEEMDNMGCRKLTKILRFPVTVQEVEIRKGARFKCCIGVSSI